MRYIYTVEGRGRFPFDMLRHDGCYPVRGVDVMNLTESGHRMVMLSGALPPTMDRWASFSWYVYTDDSDMDWKREEEWNRERDKRREGWEE